MRDRDRGISYLVELSPTLDSPERGKPLFSAAALLSGRALSAAVIHEFAYGASPRLARRVGSFRCLEST